MEIELVIPAERILRVLGLVPTIYEKIYEGRFHGADHGNVPRL